MKPLVNSIYSSPKYAKIFEWGKLISIAGSGQIIVMALGFISGLLVIRLLPTDQYALYTLANTMLASMVILADSGIGSGVMSQGAKVWQDRAKLGSVLVTGLMLRKRFASIVLLIVVPILLYLLRHHGASCLTALLVSLSILPAFFASLSSSLLEIPFKLSQNITPVQKIQVGNNFARLLLLCISLITFPFTYVAGLAAGFPQIWANRCLRKSISGFADTSQKADPVVRKEILIMVKRLLPAALYVCLAGQTTIWIISIMGSTTAVAQVGALGRLAMVLNLFSILFASLVLPRFARLPVTHHLLLKRYIQIHLAMIVLIVCILSAVWIFSTNILWILGNDFSRFGPELVLMMLGSCLYVVAQASFSLSTSKGWVINPVFSIPVCLASIILGVIFIDVSTLKGVLSHSILVASIQALMHLTYGITKINQIRENS